MLLICTVILGFLVWKNKKVFLSLQSIIVAALLCFGIINTVKIGGEYKKLSNVSPSGLEKIYTFSKTGKNVLVIVLDSGSPFYVPYIFEEKPELLKSFEGFDFYPNTTSFSYNTIP